MCVRRQSPVQFCQEVCIAGEPGCGAVIVNLETDDRALAVLENAPVDIRQRTRHWGRDVRSTLEAAHQHVVRSFGNAFRPPRSNDLNVKKVRLDSGRFGRCVTGPDPETGFPREMRARGVRPGGSPEQTGNNHRHGDDPCPSPKLPHEVDPQRALYIGKANRPDVVGWIFAMENSPEPGKITSWRQALDQGKLTSDQIAVLEGMVQEGQAENLQAAASMLDWQDAIINKPEHMYGF